MLILLADDERLFRLGLESMLEDLCPGEHSFLHARNGNEVVIRRSGQITFYINSIWMILRVVCKKRCARVCAIACRPFVPRAPRL